MSIDHEGDEHVYAQLARILLDRIDSGEIPPRRPIPSKRALREEFGVSAWTVERALDVLREAGMIRAVTGRGLFVIPEGQRRPQASPPRAPRPRRRGSRGQ
jgi:GntR family transcriptional regulator